MARKHKRKNRIRTVYGKSALSRRTFLRGSIAGATVALGLPALDAMLNDNGTAHADGSALPCRFGVFYWGCGVRHAQWLPATSGPTWDLPVALEAFADHSGLRDYLTMVTGTNHDDSSPGHIPARGIALSSSHDLTTGLPGVGRYRGQNHPEPSIDMLVAEAWGSQGTAFPSLQIAICKARPYQGNSSWKRGYIRNSFEWSPRAMFDRLFSSLPDTGDTSASKRALALERSVLDAVMADADSLLPNLGSGDRARIEHHMEGLREIEQRLVNPSICEEPMVDPDVAVSTDTRVQRHEAMIDILAKALTCDLTRIFSYEWSATQSEAVYAEDGINAPTGHHELSHLDSVSHEPIVADITRFIMKQYAALGARLMQEIEGAGNLLDNTLVLGTSEHANADAHNYRDHPFVLVGKAGGRIKAGTHWRDPNPGGNTNAPRVLLTAAHAVGATVAKLGQQDSDGARVASEPITELLVP